MVVLDYGVVDGQSGVVSSVTYIDRRLDRTVDDIAAAADVYVDEPGGARKAKANGMPLRCEKMHSRIMKKVPNSTHTTLSIACVRE